MDNDVTPGPLTALVGLLCFLILGAWILAIARLARGETLFPRRAVPRVPWNRSGVLLTIALYLGLQVVAGGFFAALAQGREMSLFELMGATSLVNLALLVLLPLCLALLVGARAAHFGLLTSHFGQDLIQGIFAGLLFTPLVYALQLLAVQVWEPTAHPLLEMLQKDRSWPVVLLAITSAVILAPLAEEFMFRVILQGWLDKQAYRAVEPTSAEVAPMPVEAPAEPLFDNLENPWAAPSVRPIAWSDAMTQPESLTAEPIEMVPPEVARTAGPLPILITSVVFAGVHFAQWPAPLPLLLLAIGLGILYRRSGGLVAPAAMHATFNGISTLLMFAAFESGAMPEPQIPPASGQVITSTALNAGELLNLREDVPFSLAQSFVDK